VAITGLEPEFVELIKESHYTFFQNSISAYVLPCLYVLTFGTHIAISYANLYQ